MSNSYTANPIYEQFINQEVLPGLPISEKQFWQTFESLLEKFCPQNAQLLEKRQELQEQIDTWHGKHPEASVQEYRAFLSAIGYLEREGEDFAIQTQNVDPEIATIAGPQLVVPITNARYALNAVNARFGSLYDALYGTDALPKNSQSPTKGFDLERAQEVQKWSKNWLDEVFPLQSGSFNDVTRFEINDHHLKIFLGAKETALQQEEAFIGYTEQDEQRKVLLLEHHNLKVLLSIDPEHPVGQMDQAGIADIQIESAITTIMDLEDSVATVNPEEKVHAYRNWLGLMLGNLSTNLEKGGKTITRAINTDLAYTDRSGNTQMLRRRALMLVRNVGHLMQTSLATDAENNLVYEGIIDAITTVCIAMHDILERGQNSTKGSIFIVKPKMHGSEEVQFCCDTLSFIENAFLLPENTVKIGIMDEERRTSANLKECIRRAQHRLAFINTGFLDRTGDEIHTAMNAGVFPPKDKIKNTLWIKAYENRNVDIGLACGLRGKAQIGKGMWAKPDQMAEMMESKIAHPQAGANCAWVPSPTAATLHALHYHQVSVAEKQQKLLQMPPRNSLEDLLEITILRGQNLSEDEIRAELENNAQGILGYVVRWVDQGVGCSKVPDIHNIGLMEDRATCRISSQMLANWLHHGLISKEDIHHTFQKMAQIVDQQNRDDPTYQAMAPAFSGFAYQAALDLVFGGSEAPSGYTEPSLHGFRAKKLAGS